MAQALTLLQFLVVGLGGSTLVLLVRSGSERVHPEALGRLAEFVAGHVLWLFVIPLLYGVVGGALQANVGERASQALGLAVCAILLVGLGGLNLLYLW